MSIIHFLDSTSRARVMSHTKRVSVERDKGGLRRPTFAVVLRCSTLSLWIKSKRIASFASRFNFQVAFLQIMFIRLPVYT
ncbi:hypothetical protein M3J09_003448 [Ascochyta lentis]